jgi:hypothetical protein
MKTLEHAAKKYNLKFIIYNHDDNERLDHLNTIGESENKHNLLMIGGKLDNTSKNTSKNISKNTSNNLSNNPSNNTFKNEADLLIPDDSSKNIIVNVMYIKDIQKYTKLHICPNCGYMPAATKCGCYQKIRFEEHVENCDGKLKRKLCLNE